MTIRNQALRAGHGMDLENAMYMLISVVLTVIFIYGLVKVIMDDGTALHKLLWILIMLVFNLIGVICYFLFGDATRRLGA